MFSSYSYRRVTKRQPGGEGLSDKGDGTVGTMMFLMEGTSEVEEEAGS